MLNIFKPKAPKILLGEEYFLDKYDSYWMKYISFYEKNNKKIVLPKFNLNVITVADTHNNLSDEIIPYIEKIKYEIDCVFLLGDLSFSDLKIIVNLFPNIPIFYVLGNHDDPSMYNKFNIKHLNQTPFVMKNNIKIGGFDGSIKYKDIEFPSYTQASSIDTFKEMPYVDILLSHDIPYISSSIEKCHHKGSVGMAQYIYQNQIPLNIHGHIHQNKIDILSNNCKSINVYGVQYLKFQKDKLYQINIF